MNNYDLENRLIAFSVDIIKIVNHMVNSKAGNHLAGQIVRSGTSGSLNYGETQGTESRKDFIHKMKIILKELREKYICLKIIGLAELFKDTSKLNNLINENNQLIAIFVNSLQTAKK